MWLLKWLLPVVAFGILAAVPAQDPPVVQPYKRLAENEALAIALDDLRRVGQRGGRDALITTRYVWITDGDFETLQCVSLALNWVSRGTFCVRPFPIMDPRKGMEKHVALARVDLRNYAPKIDDLNEFIKVWGELRFDPRFNLLLTKDTLEFVLGLKEQQKPAAMQGVKREDLKLDGDVLRLVGEHIDPLLIANLIDLSLTDAPVVNSGYFLTRALTAVKDDGVFKTIYGGLYYDFNGIKKSKKEKVTDLDKFLQDRGIGDAEKGIGFDKLFDDLRSDQRIAVFRSRVTGKVRAFDLLRQLKGKIGDMQGIVSISHDVKNKNFDIGRNFMLNLIPGTVKDDAREVISEKTNGLHEFALFNGDGALQEQVPPDVAADHLIPVPYGTILEPGIGCIRCHGRDGGWKPAPNDVKKLRGGRLDIFGDQNQKDRQQSDTTDRLVGLYQGDAEFKLFPRGRQDYAAAVSKASGIWKRSKDQLDVVEMASERVAKEFGRYRYTPVNAAAVLEDLGEVPVKGKETEQLKALLLPPLNVVVDGIFPEDGRIGALMDDLEIGRSDYDLVWSFIANRATRTRALREMQKQQKEGAKP